MATNIITLAGKEGIGLLLPPILATTTTPHGRHLLPILLTCLSRQDLAVYTAPGGDAECLTGNEITEQMGCNGLCSPFDPLPLRHFLCHILLTHHPVLLVSYTHMEPKAVYTPKQIVSVHKGFLLSKIQNGRLVDKETQRASVSRERPSTHPGLI